MNRKQMGSPARKGSASSLLQKANAQLRGQRVPVAQNIEKDEDDIAAYLSSINKRTQKQPQWDKFGEEDDIDISISSNEEEKMKESSVVSKFLKKKTEYDSVEIGKSTQNDTSKYLKKPQISVSIPQKRELVSKSSTSSALSKAAKFMSKFSTEVKKETVVFSDSDLEMDLSLDSDVMADVHAMKKQTPHTEITSNKQKKNFGTNEALYHEKKTTGSQFPNDKNISSTKSTSSVTGEKKSVGGNRKDSHGYDKSESSSSDVIGKGGSKFLKKKKVESSSSPSPQNAPSPEMPKPDRFRLKSSDKYATHVVLDTDEESLADFIGGLSGSTDPGSARTPRGRLSPQASSKFSKPKLSPVRTHSPDPAFGSIQEVEELSDHSNYSRDDKSIGNDSFKFNVMGIDALGPGFDLEVAEETMSRDTKKDISKLKSSSKTVKKQDSPRKEKKQGKGNKKHKEETPASVSHFGLHTVDELFGVDGGTSDASEVPSEEPEIRPQTPLRSILSPTPRSQTPRRVRLSLGGIHEIRSRSPSPEPISTGRAITSKIYTEDFEEEEFTDTAVSINTSDTDDSIRTVPDTGRSSPYGSRRTSMSRQRSIDSYADDFTETSAGSQWKSYSSRSSSRDTATYSDDYTSYVGSSDRSRSPSPDVNRQKTYRPETRSIKIQTSEIPGLWYHWNTETVGRAGISQTMGLGRVDPTPIASHVVSADALEAMTAYSPGVIALNDMLRQQLQLTQQFIDAQKRMYRSYIGSSIPDHNYTTLAETKKYIAKHKKPSLTFDEALRQVKEEMDMV